MRRLLALVGSLVLALTLAAPVAANPYGIALLGTPAEGGSLSFAVNAPTGREKAGDVEIVTGCHAVSDNTLLMSASLIVDATGVAGPVTLPSAPSYCFTFEAIGKAGGLDMVATLNYSVP